MPDVRRGEVWLVEAVDDTPTWFADHVVFGMAGVGRSFGRWPDGHGAVYPLVFPTLDRGHPEQGENAPAQLAASLVIT